ncbi:MAG: hypothetical protein NZ480_06295 [Bdellovibrionaceae bacterium]|nr:hypothetical protein [Pseudobdellovibrionaceae bacterium]MDW8189358.1 hypothetical protein [Pseudobdellovibrionaceae bacterium]
MEVLQLLGFNQTFYIQFAISLLTLIFLTNVIFRQFHLLHLERIAQTTGNELEALQLKEKVEIQRKEYEKRLLELNEQITQIFQREKEKAKLTQNEIAQNVKQQIESLQKKNKELLLNVKQDFLSQRDRLLEEFSELIYKKLVT